MRGEIKRKQLNLRKGNGMWICIMYACININDGNDIKDWLYEVRHIL